MRQTLPKVVFLSAIAACGSAPIDDETSSESLAQVGEQGSCEGVDDAAIWKPEKQATWDLQLIGPVNTSANVDIYDIDADNSAALIARLHEAGRKVVCYVNAGAWEPWRADAKKFPAEILGNPWSDTKYQDEKWFDIRRIDILGPLLGARFDAAKKKGCDAIDADNVDGFDDGGRSPDRTGFDLTQADQLRFNRFIACEAHKRGMSIGLKNNPSQAAKLQTDFDFVVSEQCHDYNECKAFATFLSAGKPVFLAEYREDLGASAEAKFDALCPEVERMGISAILKNNVLDSWRRACPSERAAAAAPTSTTR